MIWGHLKAADFINLIEGKELPLKRRAHLESCGRCTEAFGSAQNMHSQLAMSAINDDEIPEPDWFQFRADVRNSMLSRAAQRQSRVFSHSGWTGWLTRPAMSWGLAVAFAAGLSAGLLIWNRPVSVSGPTVVAPADLPPASMVNDSALSDAADEASIEPAALNSSLSSWSEFGVFEAVSQLDDKQAEKLQRLLEADIQQAPSKSPSRQ